MKERLRQAVGGGARPRRILLFESLSAKKEKQIPEWDICGVAAWLISIHIPPGCVLKPEGLSHGLKTVRRTVFTLPAVGPAFRVPSDAKRKADIPNGISAFLVRRKGLEPPTY